MMDGLSLTIGGAALTTIGGIIGAIVKAYTARNQRTEISPNPLQTEQTPMQVSWKENNEDHRDIFDRLRRVESEVAALKSDVLGVKTNIDRMYNMITAMYERIIGGKK